MNGRTRRPPLDRLNALLSFLYTLLTADCVAAVEGVGLDPQVGYLHTLRRDGRRWPWIWWRSFAAFWPTAWR